MYELKEKIIEVKYILGGFLMSKFTEKGYHVKENAPVYFTKDMDRTAKWFEDTLGWYSNIVERNKAGEGRYGVVFEILPEVEAAMGRKDLYFDNYRWLYD